jgi:hypothetical protein
MKGLHDPNVADKGRIVEKLRTMRSLGLDLVKEDIPQLSNNMELTLALVNEVLFVLDDEYERP